MNSDRTQQTATGDLFRAVSEHTAEVPVIVVATKLDQFRGIKREDARNQYEPSYEASPQERVALDKRYADYASEKIAERTDLIEAELKSLEGGHLDGCVAVARSMSCPSWFKLCN